VSEVVCFRAVVFDFFLINFLQNFFDIEMALDPNKTLILEKTFSWLHVYVIKLVNKTESL